MRLLLLLANRLFDERPVDFMGGSRNDALVLRFQRYQS